jgi:teichuronic acid biosynthesis glycosyltransferase TuaC
MKNDISVGTATVIPNGVDLSKFRPTEKPSLKKEFSFSEHKPTVLFLADPLRESKNVGLARQAFQLLDPLQANLEVRYRVAHGQVPMLLNATDVMLLTSKWEGSPNAVKEAMACNCPVVATDVGDVAWLFGDEPGHFITGFDPADVAEKIKLALQFSKEHGKTNGRQRIIKLGLDSESIAKRLISLYQSVLR